MDGDQNFDLLDRLTDIVLPTLRSQAAERPVYTAVNLRKIGEGIPMFGQISLVLAPAIAKPMSVIAPFDTGWYETCCNSSWQVSTH